MESLKFNSPGRTTSPKFFQGEGIDNNKGSHSVDLLSLLKPKPQADNEANKDLLDRCIQICPKNDNVCAQGCYWMIKADK